MKMTHEADPVASGLDEVKCKIRLIFNAWGAVSFHCPEGLSKQTKSKFI